VATPNVELTTVPAFNAMACREAAHQLDNLTLVLAAKSILDREGTLSIGASLIQSISLVS
jgi:hypothetical protein